MCLSQIKSGHIGGAVRRGLNNKECAQRGRRRAIPAHPYPRIGACASHYNNSYTTAAHDEDAARRTQQRSQGTPVGSNRSVVQPAPGHQQTQLNQSLVRWYAGLRPYCYFWGRAGGCIAAFRPSWVSSERAIGSAMQGMRDIANSPPPGNPSTLSTIDESCAERQTTP